MKHNIAFVGQHSVFPHNAEDFSPYLYTFSPIIYKDRAISLQQEKQKQNNNNP